MATWAWALVVIGAAYLALVAALLAAGRRADAVAIARLVPDCLVLVRRLARDPRVPRRRRWMLAGLLVYLVFPIDLVPDFISVAGQLDDALLLLWVLRGVLRTAGPAVVAEHWPGSERTLALVTRAAAPRSRRAGGAAGRRPPSR
jgi:uncharacterized membrane protein YkvA (DUF1232 family)